MPRRLQVLLSLLVVLFCHALPAQAINITGKVTIKGAGLAGVTITAGGRSVVTARSGGYILSGLNKGTFTVTPSLTGYTFSPVSRIVDLKTNIANINFEATAGRQDRFTISGRVSLPNDTPLSGVTLKLDGTTHSATTDASGNYVFGNLQNGTYTILPSPLAGYTFFPISRRTTVNNASSVNQNFTANPIPRPATSLLISNYSGKPDQQVMMIATLRQVGNGNGISGKTLKFFIDSQLVGTGLTNIRGMAAQPYRIPANATGGVREIKVQFDGDTDFAASTATSGLQVIAPQPSKSTTITVPLISGRAGREVTATAKLFGTAPNVPLSQKVLTFYVNGVIAGSAVTTSTGEATLRNLFSGPAKQGTYNVVVKFKGDSVYNASEGSGQALIFR